MISSMQKLNWIGKTGERTSTGRCSDCDGASFSYNNGHEVSEDGERGYRCDHCGTIKPENPPYNLNRDKPITHKRGAK